MSERCPQDGGFIGEAGCTHPNHEHSGLVKRIISGSDRPKRITPSEADAALREGFHVTNPDGVRVGFGRRLLDHINAHDAKDAAGRKTFLQFAVSTVARPDKVDAGHRGFEGRTAYAKRFREFAMLVVSDSKTGGVEYVFTIVPKRRRGR
ncbi:MAG: hypothetical protein ACI4Q3_08655 [Kiritimatiellia bacterium]